VKYILLLTLILPVLVYSQNRLSIAVEGVKTSKGKISVAIYNKSEGFLEFDKVFLADTAMAQEGITHIYINNLPGGEYALAVFHDENGNDELDTNWLGIPKESVGFSRTRMKTFGPPSFSECALIIDSDRKIRVVL
jgi:uncharacterized protein (DUF2141 family)